MDDFHDRLTAGDNSGKFDVPPVEGGAEPVVQADGLTLPVATAPDLTAAAPAAPERELTHAEKLVNPDLLAQCQAKVREFSVMAKVWKDVKEITTAPVSAQLTDFITGARGVFKVVDALRKEFS